MTLLEILRQELPKRGGWPKGADFAVQDGDGTKGIKFGAGEPSVQYEWDAVWRNTERLNWGINTSESHIRDIATLADDHATAIVTCEQYEATGWDGTGLPPVGCECEYLDSNNRKWYPVTIKYASNQIVVICFGVEQGTEIAKDIQLDKPQFRPLRTEAERAIDEMVQLSGVSTGAAKILYDAGYRK